MKATLYAAILASLVLSAGTIYGQQMELEWGTEIKASSSDAAYAPLGWYNGDYYTVKFDNKDGFLLKADKNLNVKAQPQLVTGEKDFDAEFLLFKDGTLLILNSSYEKDQKAVVVKAWEFDANGKLSSVRGKEVVKFPVEKGREAESVVYSLSPDSSKILLSMDNNMLNKDPAKFSLAVLGASDLKKIWSTIVTTEYDDDDFQLLSTAVNASGNCIVLGTVRGGEGKKYAKYSTRAFVFTTASEKGDDREIKIENKYISSAFIRFTTGDNLLISGFYNTLKSSGKEEGLEGAFIANTSIENLSTLDMKLLKIDPITKAAISPSSSFAKFIGTDELNAYHIRGINMHPDGSGYVIAEQRFVSSSYDGNTETRTYHFNHILVYRFNEFQEIQWISSVPKEQLTTIQTPVIFGISIWTSKMIRMAYKFNSYQHVEIDGKIYILYNDHKDNGNARSMKECKTMSNKKNANAVIVEIGEDGKWDKNTLFTGKEVDVILESSSCLPMPEVGFTISAEKGKDLQFGTVTIK